MYDLTLWQPAKAVRQIFKWMAIAIATLATSLAIASSAQAAVVLREDVIIDQVIVNQCLNEPLHIRGIFHVVVRETIDNAGGVHTGFHLNNAQKFHGETASGVKYVQAQGGAIVVDNAGPAVNQTITVTTILNRQGSEFPGDDQHQHTTLHFTQNANGELTAEVVNVTLECK